MKNLVFAFALLCSTTLAAQFSYHVDENGYTGTGIQSPTNTASGNFTIAMGYNTNTSGNYSVAIGHSTLAIGIQSTAIGKETIASGIKSTAMGELTSASGPLSTAMGNNTEASGGSSTAMGNNTTASGPSSTAMGKDTTASGSFSIAIGDTSTASGERSTAMGNNTEASGSSSTAMGRETKAIGNSAIAMGQKTTASGDWSTAMGFDTTASGNRSTAMGLGTIASGLSSIAIGQLTTASDFGTTAIGVRNKTDETPNPTSFSGLNTAFVIGNGGYDSEGNYLGNGQEYNSNAFEVLFDGTTTIAGDLNINSDARLKANIISLGGTLSKLLQIDGKTYTMKKDANHKKKIGLLAQDIEKVFPELVTETNDIKSVNYQGLVPVLINAMKEQQEEIDELKVLVKQFLEK